MAQFSEATTEAEEEVPPTARGGEIIENEPATVLPPSLLSGVELRRAADGGLRLDASPEASRAIAGLLERLARMLQSAAD